MPSQVGKVKVDVSRTGYTGDLGYELWIPAASAVKVWDALIAAGGAYGIRPAGMLALDVVRLEAGLILLEVDYTSARHAMNPEQNYSPGEIGLGRLVDFEASGDFVGRLALEREARAGGPARRLVGLQLDWYDIEGLYDAQGLPPAISPSVDRQPVPVFAARPPGRSGDEPRLEPDPQAGHRARLGLTAARGAGDQPERRMDGRRAARAGRSDGRRNPLPGPRAQARLSVSAGLRQVLRCYAAVTCPQCSGPHLTDQLSCPRGQHPTMSHSHPRRPDERIVTGVRV